MLHWDTKYMLGISEIDQEHKEIINTLNILSELVMKEDGAYYLKEILAFINNYVSHHFNHEEKIMLAYTYPEYNSHKEIHDAFKNTVDRWNNSFPDGHASLEEVRNLIGAIEDWIVIHLDETDSYLANYLIERRV